MENRDKMMDKKTEYSKLPINTRQQLADLFQAMTNPLISYYTRGNAGLRLGNGGCHYSVRANECESFLRILWGLAPYTAGGFSSNLTRRYLQGLEHGVDPQDEEYFGDARNFDQRLVEMAALAFALILNKETFWVPLPQKAKENMYHWLNQIFVYQVGNNNWNFFRILVGLAFEQLSLEYDKEQFERTLQNIEQLYRGEGWYEDGQNGSFDYYNAWAFQFYGAIYYKFRRDTDKERCERFKNRLIEHARQMKYWFSEEGSMIPYGRSLVYRFAQTSAYAALAYAGIEAIPYGESRHIIFQNLRWWLKQPIFERDGILSVGYAYPNGVMSEDYNSPGGAYWAMKPFLILALEKNHPFWQAQETPVHCEKSCYAQRRPGFLIQRNDPDKNVILLSGTKLRNTRSGYYFGNFPDKYNKFAYSTQAGFSIQRGHTSEKDGAFDSILALSMRGEENYSFRTKQELLSLSDRYILLQWNMFQNQVRAKTLLLPWDGWHVRVHRLETEMALSTIEGGFCIPRTLEINAYEYPASAHGVKYASEGYVTVLEDLFQDREAIICCPVANTNILFERTFLPVLKKELEPGTHYFACAVFSGKEREYVQKQLKHSFQASVRGNQVVVTCDSEQIYSGVI